MSYAIKIDNQTVSVETFVKYLKLTNQFNSLASEFIRFKIAASEAKKKGLEVSDSELQDAADAIRTSLGLTKAKDMQAWLDTSGISIEEFELFILEHLYMHKLIDNIATDDKIDERFRSVQSGLVPVDARYKLKAEIVDDLYREWIENKIQSYQVSL